MEIADHSRNFQCVLTNLHRRQEPGTFVAGWAAGIAAAYVAQGRLETIHEETIRVAAGNLKRVRPLVPGHSFATPEHDDLIRWLGDLAFPFRLSRGRCRRISAASSDEATE